jgi:hypothetical protein
MYSKYIDNIDKNIEQVLLSLAINEFLVNHNDKIEKMKKYINKSLQEIEKEKSQDYKFIGRLYYKYRLYIYNVI